MAATTAQILHNRMAKAICKALRVQPSTFKHRALAGTVSAPSATGNTVVTGAKARTTLAATTDFKVYATWEEVMVRSGSADGGDTAAGRAWIARLRGQCPLVDINNVPISYADEDWLVAPDGALFKVENPAISADGTHIIFTMISQR